jgi:UDP-GlcNAc:undecaprenyl-phosphate GlcNAc-1-phosphate transferase
MPLLNRVALRTGFVDHPNARKIHSHPIPLLGGVAVYLGVIGALISRGPLDLGLGLIMLASFLVMALGVIDDRIDLQARYRPLIQIGIAGGLSLMGIRFHFFPIELLNHLVTMLWIVGVINAMNCLDCADGAAGSTCAVAFAALAAIALGNGRFYVAQAALAGAGAVVGFLMFNAPPARVFLGDTGSTFLGLMTAVLALLADPSDASHWQLPVAPLVLAVPVFDIVWVHYRRREAGIRSIRDLLSSAGKDHLPHRLMARGLSKRGCMAVVALSTGLAAAAAWCLGSGHWLAAGLCAIFLGALLWHLEENAEVVLRAEDQVAIYRLLGEVNPTGKSAAAPDRPESLRPVADRSRPPGLVPMPGAALGQTGNSIRLTTQRHKSGASSGAGSWGDEPRR